MVCPYCKKIIPDSSIYCPECGRSVKTQEMKETNRDNVFWENVKVEDSISDKQQAHGWEKIFFLMLGLIIVMLIVISIIFVSKKDKNINDENGQSSDEILEDTDMMEESNTDDTEEESDNENHETDANTGNESLIEEESLDKDVETFEVNTESPFNQKYWVIFTEAYRGDRVEASSIDSTISPEELYFIWDSSIELNDTSGSDECDQYYLTDSDEWEQIGSYSRLTDGASSIIASNLDVYDAAGNIICKGCAFSDIDWSLIDQNR